VEEQCTVARDVKVAFCGITRTSHSLPCRSRRTTSTCALLLKNGSARRVYKYDKICHRERKREIGEGKGGNVGTLPSFLQCLARRRGERKIQVSRVTRRTCRSRLRKRNNVRDRTSFLYSFTHFPIARFHGRSLVFFLSFLPSHTIEFENRLSRFSRGISRSTSSRSLRRRVNEKRFDLDASQLAT